jgi:cytidylate kinase
MAVITISREYGSRGEQIAQQVAKEFGYSYFDKKILADVACAANATEEQIRCYDEKDEHGLRRFLRRFFMPRYPSSVQWLHYAPELYLEWSLDSAEEAPALDADKVTSLFREIIESLWKRGNVVIVGRGSQRILDDKPGTFHVRVMASINDRVEAVIASEGLIYPKALKRIKTIDKQRGCYLKHYYRANWADAALYNLVLNTSFMSVEQAVRTTITAVYRQQNEHSEQGDALAFDERNPMVVNDDGEMNRLNMKQQSDFL